MDSILSVLSVVIGLVFIFALLSILVTQINTLISNGLRLRARHLRDGIGDLIQDEELRAKVLAHPLITLIKDQIVLPDQRITQEQINKIINGAVEAVEWINPKAFVSVLISVIRVDSDKELFGALLDIIDGMPAGEERRRLRLQVNHILSEGSGFSELNDLINGLDDATYKAALVRALGDIQEEIADLGLESNSNIALLAGLRKIKNPYFRETMKTILSTSKTLEEAEQQIKDWFNDGMSRASQSFQRHMRAYSLGVGLLIAVVLNVDVIYLAQALYNTELGAAVEEVARSTAIEELQARVEEAEEAAASDEEGNMEDVVAAASAARATLEDLLALNLPLGWSFDNLSDDPDDSVRRGDARFLWNYLPWNNDGWLGLLVLKIIGIAGTTIAVAQGAPFWFDILRILTTRSSSD